MTADTSAVASTEGQVLQAGEVRLSRLESLRALAALSVLEGHVWGSLHSYSAEGVYGTFWRRTLLGGGAGVFVFFALSGYLLFWPFVRRHFAAGPAVDLPRYARNRALRILPLYYAAIIVLMLLGGHAGEGTLWWRHALFVQSMWSDTNGVLDGSLWSVSVEIQFYVLLPVIAVVVAWLSRRSKALATVLLLLAALGSAVASWKLNTHSANPGNPWAYQLPTTFMFFVGGMAVALLRQAMLDRHVAVPRGPAGSAGVWALLSVGGWLLFNWHIDQDFWLAPAGFLLVGSLVLPLRRGRWVRVLDWRPLALLGVISYSIYVWHLPIIDWLDAGRSLPTFPLALAAMTGVSLVVAFVSYRIVETPFLRLRRQWAASAAPKSDTD